MVDALKPCPFCGGEAEIERRGDRRQSTIYSCTECSCSLETGEEWDYGRDWNRRSTLSDAVAEREAEPVAWQPMDTAPKGCVTEDAGIRGASEWFFGRVSPEFRKQGAAPFVVIRRRAWPQEDSWCCNGGAHYVPRYFDAWAPLDARLVVPPTSELEALRKRVAELEKALRVRPPKFPPSRDYKIQHMNGVDAYRLGWFAALRAARRVREGGKVDG